MGSNKYDFSGYATRNDLKCSDGLTIRSGAFKDNDGQSVPLVWQHMHDSPDNVLGHARLENRPDGVYAYCLFNDTPAGENAKQLVQHKDVSSLSIYANKLVKRNKDVLHGAIREVSLVLSGANPGALIDNITIQHGDEIETLDTEAIIYTGETIATEDELKHEDSGDNMTQQAPEQTSGNSEKTVEDVFNELTDEQKQVVYFIVGQAVEDAGGDDTEDSDEDAVEQSGMYGDEMHHNVFDGNGDNVTEEHLSHSQIEEIFADAKEAGSLKDSVLFHANEYGITNIDMLFPDAKSIDGAAPSWVKRRTEWVAGVISGTHHSPFSRIKTSTADITQDTARAKGYIKGHMKKEEFFKVAKRTTGPTTIYKKQKLDRDDILDITDFDVVSWIKQEMRVMLDEEIARAILIGDGREIDDEDKIDENCIRPIWKDDEFYATHIDIEKEATVNEFVDTVTRSMDDYQGSGSPTMYARGDFVTDMLLQRDTLGHRIYKTESELASTLGVSNIVRVPVMKNQTRTAEDGKKRVLQAIIVNLKDYTAGADRGGEVSMFDDFDIDYNQYKYLLEGRMSGALASPKTAIVIEQLDA